MSIFFPFVYRPHPYCSTRIDYVQSYGSVITTHLLHMPQIAQKIGSMLFIDPVSFLLHLPDVAYNFVGCPEISSDNSELITPQIRFAANQSTPMNTSFITSPLKTWGSRTRSSAGSFGVRTFCGRRISRITM